ncbi:MAG: glycoside hydrolase family 16 protein [Pseudomonadota bacterium]
MTLSRPAIFILAALISSGCVSSPVADVVADPTDPTATLTERGWALVWSDEFDGDALDRTKWVPEVSCWGGGNQERQCYLDREANVSVSDGHLHLKAFAETVSGSSVHMEHPDYPGTTIDQDYASGKVRTRDLAYWTYGRIEGRMKLPGGQGAWPAFWMMPQFDVHGGWPLSGEIDIMEAVNLGATCSDCDDGDIENRSSGALHFGKAYPANEYVTRRRALTDLPDQDGLPREQFHTYAVEWGEGRIDWFVDGDRFYSVSSDAWYTEAVDKSVDPNAPFNEDFYVMLNFAVGGAWPERDNETGFDPDILPAEFVIDYVRVYQCADDLQTGRACMMDD